MKTALRIRNLALVTALTAALAACAGSHESEHAAADRAWSALSRGDTSTAESQILDALRQKPQDPYALLIAGMVYQSMGQYGLARQYYQVILTNGLQGMIMMPGEGGVVRAQAIPDVARANLGVVDRILGQSESGTAAVSGAGMAEGGAVAARPSAAGAEANVAGRFRILKRLLDGGLITPTEYSSRRAANLGALLPLSAAPPAIGLERPVPADAQVIDRLNALKTAVAAREMLPADASAERQTILDALLPAHPAAQQPPPLPPKDMIQAADAVGRVERMREAGLVTPAEADQEKAAIKRALDTQLAQVPVSGTATGLQYDSATPIGAAATAGNWGVALAWGRTEAVAKREWTRLQARFPHELGDKQASIEEVRTSHGKRWRVIAQPAGSQDAAQSLCRALKLHRQVCDPVSPGK
jgi:hypothetical protein